MSGLEIALVVVGGLSIVSGAYGLIKGGNKKMMGIAQLAIGTLCVVYGLFGK